jgi:hypothetical protein
VGLIYLDACLLIYLAERHSRWHGPVAGALAAAEEARFAISPLVKLECLVGPIARGDPVLERAYIELFDLFVSLAMPELVYLQAAQLRARFSPKTPCTSPVLSITAVRRYGPTTIVWRRPRTGWRTISCAEA